MSVRRVVGLLIAFALLVGSVVPALASENGASAWFLDVPNDHWSFPYVLEMQAKGLMQGTGDGRFEPQAPLTRAQAVTVAIRLMGFEYEAQTFGRVDDMMLPFSDRGEIPSWASPYIAVAVDHDILPVAEDGLFRADEKATRLWVSVLLVRALGFDASAQAKMMDELPFRDGHLIPASLVGYVAAAVDHELVQGFPDRTFQPNQPLTRAEAAALLSRTDSQLGDLGRLRPGFLTGDLVRVDTRAYTITARVQGKERVVPVDREAPIFFDDRSVTLGNLPVGSRLSIVVDQWGTALLIMARKPVVDVGQNEVEGRITSLIQPKEMAGGLGLLVIEPSKGKERSFPLAPEIKVTYQGRSLGLGDLRVGDEVQVRVVAGVAIGIDVLQRASQPTQSEIKGEITAVRPGTNSTLATLEVRTASGKTTVKVAPGAAITSAGNRIQLTDLQVGDQVTITVAQGVAVRIVVTQPVRREETVKGTIETVYPATKTAKARVTVKTDKGSRTITLESNVSILHGRTKLSVTDLRVGDKVTVKLVNGVGEEIKVDERAPLVEEVKGLIQAVYGVSINFQSSIVVATDKGSRTITLAPKVSILHGKTKLTLEDLRVGDRVTVKVVDGIGEEIKVEQRGPLVEEIEGSIERINPSTRTAKASLVVKTNTGVKTVSLADHVSILQGRTRLTLGDLRVGDWVTVKVVDGTGQEIKVGERGPVVEEVKGLIQAVYAVSIRFQSSIEVKTDKGIRTIVLASDATISHGRNRLNLDDLRVGDQVTIKVVDGLGTTVTVEQRGPLVEEVAGLIDRITPSTRTAKASLVIRTDRTTRTISLAPDVVISHGRIGLRLEDLQIGDRVTVKVVDGTGTEVRVEEQVDRATEVKGQIQAVYEFSITFQPSIEVKTDRGTQAITLADDVFIARGQTKLTLADLRVGDWITAKVVNDRAVEIQVDNSVRTSEIEGSIVAIRDRQITIQTKDGRERTLTLARNATLIHKGRSISLDRLSVGDKVELRVEGDVIQRLELDD